MGEINVDDLVKKIEDTLAEARKDIADNGGFDWHDFKDIYETVIVIAAIAIEAGGEFAHLTMEERKQAIAKAINKMVDVPLVPENLEEKMFQFIVGFAISSWEERKGKV